MRRSWPVLSLFAALACGHTAGHSAQQELAPLAAVDSLAGPLVACMDNVLAHSTLVERIRPDGRRVHPRSRGVELRNPPSLRLRGLGFAVNPERGTPRELAVEYVWPGTWVGAGGMQPPPDARSAELEGVMMTDIATALLSDVRAQCAPTAPGEPACSRVSQGRTGRCSIGL